MEKAGGSRTTTPEQVRHNEHRPSHLAFTKYLVISKTESSHAPEPQNTIIAAAKTGEVKAPAADPTTGSRAGE